MDKSQYWDLAEFFQHVESHSDWETEIEWIHNEENLQAAKDDIQHLLDTYAFSIPYPPEERQMLADLSLHILTTTGAPNLSNAEDIVSILTELFSARYWLKADAKPIPAPAWTEEDEKAYQEDMVVEAFKEVTRDE